ncbi:hypothetical protein BC937DRAFT_87577 [Endogone sp. FLAS-F59071]|nr:hypothetical protein BC937DRAFT_87577 [Endogone sp. FLAS-F59071]|eukprot:RUS19376.1 hypothetical protein BC937DRAFT_87577 [Endogone sp. FLAS-F59071]
MSLQNIHHRKFRSDDDDDDGDYEVRTLPSESYPYHDLYYLDRGSHVQNHTAHAYTLDVDLTLKEILLKLDETSTKWLQWHTYPGAVIQVPEALIASRQHLPVKHVQAYLYVLAGAPPSSSSSPRPSLKLLTGRQDCVGQFRQFIEPLVREVQKISTTRDRGHDSQVLICKAAYASTVLRSTVQTNNFTEFTNRLLSLKRALPGEPRPLRPVRRKIMQVRGEDELTMGVEEVEGEGQLVEKRDWGSVHGEYGGDGNVMEDDEDSCLDAADLEHRRMQHQFGQRLFEELLEMGVKDFAGVLYPYMWRPGGQGS